MAVTLYCAWSDVADRASAAGAALRTDDDPASRASVLRRAATKVNLYCELNYGVASLATSAWVKETAADIALYYACTRRGNPAPKSVADIYQEAIESLKLAASGIMTIPDAPMTKAMAPVLSNQLVRQGPVSELKVVPGKSTGTPAGYTQHTDWTDTLDYSI